MKNSRFTNFQKPANQLFYYVFMAGAEGLEPSARGFGEH